MTEHSVATDGEADEDSRFSDAHAQADYTWWGDIDEDTISAVFYKPVDPDEPATHSVREEFRLFGGDDESDWEAKPLTLRQQFNNRVAANLCARFVSDGLKELASHMDMCTSLATDGPERNDDDDDDDDDDAVPMDMDDAYQRREGSRWTTELQRLLEIETVVNEAENEKLKEEIVRGHACIYTWLEGISAPKRLLDHLTTAHDEICDHNPKHSIHVPLYTYTQAVQEILDGVADRVASITGKEELMDDGSGNEDDDDDDDDDDEEEGAAEGAGDQQVDADDTTGVLTMAEEPGVVDLKADDGVRKRKKSSAEGGNDKKARGLTSRSVGREQPVAEDDDIDGLLRQGLGVVQKEMDELLRKCRVPGLQVDYEAEAAVISLVVKEALMRENDEGFLAVDKHLKVLHSSGWTQFGTFARSPVGLASTKFVHPEMLLALQAEPSTAISTIVGHIVACWPSVTGQNTVSDSARVVICTLVTAVVSYYKEVWLTDPLKQSLQGGIRSLLALKVFYDTGEIIDHDGGGTARRVVMNFFDAMYTDATIIWYNAVSFHTKYGGLSDAASFMEGVSLHIKNSLPEEVRQMLPEHPSTYFAEFASLLDPNSATSLSMPEEQILRLADASGRDTAAGILAEAAQKRGMLAAEAVQGCIYDNDHPGSMDKLLRRRAAVALSAWAPAPEEVAPGKKKKKPTSEQTKNHEAAQFWAQYANFLEEEIQKYRPASEARLLRMREFSGCTAYGNVLKACANQVHSFVTFMSAVMKPIHAYFYTPDDHLLYLVQMAIMRSNMFANFGSFTTHATDVVRYADLQIAKNNILASFTHASFQAAMGIAINPKAVTSACKEASETLLVVGAEVPSDEPVAERRRFKLSAKPRSLMKDSAAQVWTANAIINNIACDNPRHVIAMKLAYGVLRSLLPDIMDISLVQIFGKDVVQAERSRKKSTYRETLSAHNGRLTKRAEISKLDWALTGNDRKLYNQVVMWLSGAGVSSSYDVVREQLEEANSTTLLQILHTAFRDEKAAVEFFHHAYIKCDYLKLGKKTVDFLLRSTAGIAACVNLIASRVLGLPTTGDYPLPLTSAVPGWLRGDVALPDEMATNLAAISSALTDGTLNYSNRDAVCIARHFHEKMCDAVSVIVGFIEKESAPSVTYEHATAIAMATLGKLRVISATVDRPRRINDAVKETCPGLQTSDRVDTAGDQGVYTLAAVLTELVTGELVSVSVAGSVPYRAPTARTARVIAPAEAVMIDLAEVRLLSQEESQSIASHQSDSVGPRDLRDLYVFCTAATLQCKFAFALRYQLWIPLSVAIPAGRGLLKGSPPDWAVRTKIQMPAVSITDHALLFWMGRVRATYGKVLNSAATTTETRSALLDCTLLSGLRTTLVAFRDLEASDKTGVLERGAQRLLGLAGFPVAPGDNIAVATDFVEFLYRKHCAAPGGTWTLDAYRALISEAVQTCSPHQQDADECLLTASEAFFKFLNDVLLVPPFLAAYVMELGYFTGFCGMEATDTFFETLFGSSMRSAFRCDDDKVVTYSVQTIPSSLAAFLHLPSEGGRSADDGVSVDESRVKEIKKAARPLNEALQSYVCDAELHASRTVYSAWGQDIDSRVWKDVASRIGAQLNNRGSDDEDVLLRLISAWTPLCSNPGRELRPFTASTNIMIAGVRRVLAAASSGWGMSESPTAARIPLTAFKTLILAICPKPGNGIVELGVLQQVKSAKPKPGAPKG